MWHIGRFSMSDILNEIIKALPPWAVLQFAGFGGITYAVIMAMRRGERDRKTGGGDSSTPRWFANEQTLDLLRDIRTELHHQSSLLEQIANENMINPRRLQE